MLEDQGTADKVRLLLENTASHSHQSETISVPPFYPNPEADEPGHLALAAGPHDHPRVPAPHHPPRLHPADRRASPSSRSLDRGLHGHDHQRPLPDAGEAGRHGRGVRPEDPRHGPALHRAPRRTRQDRLRQGGTSTPRRSEPPSAPPTATWPSSWATPPTSRCRRRRTTNDPPRDADQDQARLLRRRPWPSCCAAARRGRSGRWRRGCRTPASRSVRCWSTVAPLTLPEQAWLIHALHLLTRKPGGYQRRPALARLIGYAPRRATEPNDDAFEREVLAVSGWTEAVFPATLTLPRPVEWPVAPADHACGVAGGRPAARGGPRHLPRSGRRRRPGVVDPGRAPGGVPRRPLRRAALQRLRLRLPRPRLPSSCPPTTRPRRPT